MGDTNYISSIVKILETPTSNVFDKNISVTQFRAQIPQVRNNMIIYLTFWGKLSQDIVDYCKIDDYIIVEGYLSFRNKKLSKNSKRIEITVLKFYPFLLNYSRQK